MLASRGGREDQETETEVTEIKTREGAVGGFIPRALMRRGRRWH